ncbi:MAG: hypothetical protein ACLGI2_08835 [Acidimicrobiia bacterium]
MVTSGPPDPVRARRRQIGALAALAKRAGYLCFGVAVIAFVAAAMAQFPSPLVTVVVASMAVGSVLLAPAIVVAYGVQKAEREDPVQ